MFNHMFGSLTKRDFAPPGSIATSVVGTIAHHENQSQKYRGNLPLGKQVIDGRMQHLMQSFQT